MGGLPRLFPSIAHLHGERRLCGFAGEAPRAEPEAPRAVEHEAPARGVHEREDAAQPDIADKLAPQEQSRLTPRDSAALAERRSSYVPTPHPKKSSVKPPPNPAPSSRPSPSPEKSASAPRSRSSYVPTPHPKKSPAKPAPQTSTPPPSWRPSNAPQPRPPAPKGVPTIPPTKNAPRQSPWQKQPTPQAAPRPAAPSKTPAPERRSAPRERPPVTCPPEWRVNGGSPATEEWLKRQEEHLDNRFTFQAPSGAGQILAQRGLDSSALTEAASSNKPATMRIDGEVWEIGFFGTPPEVSVAMRLQDDPETMVQIPDEARLSAIALQRYAARAKEHRMSERRDAAGMSSGFDIAEGGPVAYMEVADLDDRLTKSIATDTAPFADMLAARYDVYRGPGSAVDASKTPPFGAIATYVGAMYDKGIRNFYFNIYAHGSEGAMHFGANTLQMDQLQRLFLQFPDCRFTVNTISCFGGGVTAAMRNFRDAPAAEKGRIAVFAQTKGDVPNFRDTNVRFDEQNTLQQDYSTLYNAALAHYLMQGVGGRPGKKLSYGEAHLLADKLAKQKFTDAEVTTSQPGAPSNYTAGVERPSGEYNV